MKYIECPNVYTPQRPERSLFLGGGITSCPLWQPVMVDLLKGTDLTLLNPRRKHFDVTDPNIEEEQIRWEYEHLAKASAVMFWFPSETLCPITLFELGKYLVSGRRLFIGHHPDYQRRRDIRIQVGLERPAQAVHESLPEVAAEIRQWANTP